MSGTVWVPGAEFLQPVGAAGQMLNDAPARVIWHTTEAPSGTTSRGAQYFDAMAAVLRAKKAEPHLLWDPVTDRLGQFFGLDKAARAVKNDPATGCQTNRTGAACIQIEVVAQAANPFTSYWTPGPNYRALMAALRSWGIPEEFPAGELSRAGEAVSRDHHTWMTRGGHYGHVHVPGNQHWDCGFIDTAELFRAGAPDWEEDFMASIHDKVIQSPIPGDDNKLVSPAELLMYLAATVNRLDSELTEARDGRLGEDLRKAHNWLKNFSWGLGEHLAVEGDRDRNGAAMAKGGRFLQSLVSLSRRA